MKREAKTINLSVITSSDCLSTERPHRPPLKNVKKWTLILKAVTDNKDHVVKLSSQGLKSQLELNASFLESFTP